MNNFTKRLVVLGASSTAIDSLKRIVERHDSFENGLFALKTVRDDLSEIVSLLEGIDTKEG